MHRVVSLLLLVLMVKTRVVLSESDCKPDVTCEDLDVKYKQESLACDSAQKPSDVSSAPDVFYTGDDKADTFLLMMVDPDAPSRDKAPQCGYWLHWMLQVTVGENDQLQMAEGGQLMEYAGPTPPPGSGSHRYQILLYSLPSSADVTSVPESRGDFNLENFESDNGLSGKKVAKFQFKAEN